MTIPILKKISWKNLRRLALCPYESVQVKSLSIAFGVFMGILPVWGFQLVLGVPLAMLFKMNKVLVILFKHISVFPLTPIFWLMSLLTGNLILGKPNRIPDRHNLSLAYVKSEGISFFLGGVVLALICGTATYFATYGLLGNQRRLRYSSIKMKRAIS